MALLPPQNNWLIPVETSQEARAILNEFAAQQGYAITVKTSNSRAVQLHCDRSGQPRRSPKQAEGPSRDRPSRACGCRFSAYMKRVSGGWFFTVKDPSHSGHIGSEPAAHPTHRRRQLADTRERVLQLFLLRHSNQEVLDILRHERGYGKPNLDVEDPYKAQIRLKTRDLGNLRYRSRKQFLKGRSPTSALLTGIQDWDLLWKGEDGGSHQVQHVFLASHSGLDLLARFPSLLWIDATYKTNRHRMPMVNIVGRSANGKTFYIACAFISYERECAYQWVLESLRDLLHARSIPLPITIFSDDARSLLAALATVFPSTTSLLCVWHIQKNIETRLRPMIAQYLLLEKDGDIRDEINSRWSSAKKLFNQVIFAPTMVDMETAWQSFQEEFAHEAFAEAIEYISDQWMVDDTKQRFLRCYTNKTLHFGETASSRVEGSHAYLKRFIRWSTGDLLTVMNAVRTAVASRHIAINQSIVEDRQLVPERLATALFRSVLGWIAPKALLQVARLLEDHHKAEGKVAVCTHYHRQSLGLPCIHEILVAQEAHQALTRDQFHSQWWLRTSLQDDYQLLNIDSVLEIEDPATATTSGRPRGRANHPRKNPKAATEKTTKRTTRSTTKLTTRSTTKPTTEKTTKAAIEKTTKRATRSTRSTQRYPSKFETVAKRTARVGRGRGRG